MNFVKIKDDKSAVHLSVSNKKLNLTTVRAYFPHVSGLTYFTKENIKCGLTLNNDEFELIPGVTEYEIYSVNVLKEHNQNDLKRKRIHEIMDIIEGKQDENLIDQDIVENRQLKKTRIVSIGWKHKTNANEDVFKQMREPYGGIKKLELNYNNDYSFDEIKKLAVEAMKNMYNENIWGNSLIQLANSNGEIFDKFTAPKGKKSTFWEFCNCKLKCRNSQLRLFLLSTTQKNHASVKSEDSVKVVLQNKATTSAQVHLSHQSSLKVPVAGSRLRFSVSNKKGSSSITLENHISTDKKDNDFDSVRFNETARTKLPTPVPIKEDEEILNLSIPTIEVDQIKFTDNILGRGSFGCVKLATWHGTEVAVKCLKASDNIKYLLREINVMDKIRHPNLISIMAVCFTDLKTYIVMECFESSSLTSFILNVEVNLDYAVKKNRNYLISLQICKGISYLHELNPVVLHKDLKPDNILINKNFEVKICDLGLSKICDIMPALNTTVGQNFHGTPMYMAPEILIDNEPGTVQSDVWSMACCITELFSEKSVWDVTPNFTIPNLRKTILKLKKPSGLAEIPISIRDHVSACFEYELTKRPKALILLELFKRFYKKNL